MRTLQEGVYYDCSDCTGPFFSIIFLRASPEAEPARIGATLGRLWSMYQGLKNGQVEDLPDHPVAPGDLQVLESAPVLEQAAFYSGHQRDDRRSWIDFHDGINNLPKRGASESSRSSRARTPAGPWAAPTSPSCASRSTWPRGGACREPSRNTSSAGTS